MSIALNYCYAKYVFDINVISREAGSLVNKLGGYLWPFMALLSLTGWLLVPGCFTHDYGLESLKA